ncbi:wall-associated receptor kinase 2-like [Lolium rigidum]|uniref:wall-associated receptor kinase 2-like n=1 Tax=Lolium rigidum TaxID=89674 RepID=UPI001F5C945E|nr:wall-associated receptor kinase 2-like [Lolium rigidum]
MSPPKATMLLLVLATALLVVATAGADNPTAKEGCQSSCGGVDIPYPFGIGANCFRPGFEILCDNSSGVYQPLLPGATSRPDFGIFGFLEGWFEDQVRVLSLNVTPRAEIRVETKVAYECFDILGNRTDDFPGGLNVSATSTRDVYRISNSRNELYVLGCNTFIYTGSGEPARNAKSYYGGCVAYCKDEAGPKDGACEGIGCCHIDLPPGLTDTSMELNQGWSHADLDYSPCNFAFIVEKGRYSFKAADLKHMPMNQTMPLVLDWAIRDSTSCSAIKESACVSVNSRCADSENGLGYVCHCSDGYEGNPYVQNGCQDINECQSDPAACPKHSECTNIAGSHTCKCSKGYTREDDSNTLSCVAKSSKFPLAAKLTVGIVLGLSLVVIALLLVLVFFQKRQLDKSFEKNGGKVLQNVKGLTIFTKEGLKKITRNNSDFLGNGAFGNVYKGTLPDDTIVAVKGSIVVNEESRKDFTDEVEIQTNMIHKNILRLVGCCLEVEVPMLVYEFAANGSLQDILHQKKNQELPLDLRLDIAIGAAEGLKYMHSSTAQAIRHGDVKPDNILLDENLTPKISDFGLSKLNIEGQFAKKVVGCMGYVDPVFLKTGLLTQKSDVYSFGAVLLELITGKKNVYGENQSLIIDFCKVYEKENSGRAMFDEEIATEEDMFVLEEISKLAIDCLCEDIEERPDMTEVAERLVMLRRDKKLKKTLGTYGSLEDITMATSPIQQRT